MRKGFSRTSSLHCVAAFLATGCPSPSQTATGIGASMDRVDRMARRHGWR